MKIFMGRSRDQIESVLCKDCLEKVRGQFEKDEKGKIVLSGEIPKLCEECKKKMKNQFNRSVYPDRE
jgi:hypothetical protein